MISGDKMTICGRQNGNFKWKTVHNVQSRSKNCDLTSKADTNGRYVKEDGDFGYKTLTKLIIFGQNL